MRGPPSRTQGGPEEGTHFSPGGSSHRTPGLGHWRLCSCSSRCPLSGLSAGRGNGPRHLHKSQWCLLVSSGGHLPETRSLGALGSLKLQGKGKAMRSLESTLHLWGGDGAAEPEGRPQSGVQLLSSFGPLSYPSTPYSTKVNIPRQRQSPQGGGIQGDSQFSR